MSFKSSYYEIYDNSSFRYRNLLIFIVIALSAYTADINGWIPSKIFNQYFLSLKHSINSKVIESTETWRTWQDWLVSWNKMHEQNIDLKNTIKLNKEWQLEALKLRIENKNLQKLLNFKETNKSSLTKVIGLGRIISYGTRKYPFSAVLSMSNSNQIIKLNSILLQGGSLAGRAIESGNGWVRLLHVIDSSSHIPVETQRSGDRAILTGNNSPKPYLEYLTEFHQIVSGDIILTSGHGGIFPAGIPVGTVQKNKNGQYQVIPFASYHSIGWLRIIPAKVKVEIDNN